MLSDEPRLWANCRSRCAVAGSRRTIWTTSRLKKSGTPNLGDDELGWKVPRLSGTPCGEVAESRLKPSPCQSTGSNCEKRTEPSWL